MHAKAVAALEKEPVSDLEEEEEVQGASKRASKGARSSKSASAKKRDSKLEILQAEPPKRARTEQEFCDEEFFPRGWKGSGVDETFAPIEDCVVYFSIWQVHGTVEQKLEQGSTFIVHSNDGTSTEIMVVLVYKHISSSRMFAVCTDRPNNGTEWASPDICSAPRLLKLDLVRPSSLFRGKFPFSTLEMQAFMTRCKTIGRESSKYRTFWNSAVAPNTPRPPASKKPKPDKEPPAQPPAWPPAAGAWSDLGTGSSLSEMLDTAVSKVMQKMTVPKNAQMGEIQRANMEAEIQRVRGESQREREEDRKEQQRVREEEQKRYREAEDERNRKERERMAEQQTYERGLLKERDRQMEADTLFMRQQLVNHNSVIGATLGATLGASYYHYSANYQREPALASLAPVPAPAPLQPLLAHAPAPDSALLLTDMTNVPGPVAAPIPRSKVMDELEKWLKENKIGCNDKILKAMEDYQCGEGADLLLMESSEWTSLGFMGAAILKLTKLKEAAK
jgi:hypothetical protein